MHINLSAAVLNIKLLHLIYDFKINLGLNLNFEIKFAQK